MKKIKYHDQDVFMPGIQGCFNILQINKCNIAHKQNQKQNHIINSIDAEKAFDKIQQPFMIKALKKVGIEGTYLNMINSIYD
jgi:alpha-D-ribose 1-methylphosphonate 5-triphosphate diphosphatase PhnM